MSQGWFLVHRGWTRSPMFHQAEFCERAAWIWMLEKACWQPHKIRISGNAVMLQRGQFAHSLGFLAETWGWHVSRVRRFLNRLEIGTAIGTATDTGRLVVTILNYNDYQSFEEYHPTQQPTQQPTRHRHSSDTIKNEVTKLTKVNEEGVSPAPLIFLGENFEEVGASECTLGEQFYVSDEWGGYAIERGWTVAKVKSEQVKFRQKFKGLTKPVSGWRKTWLAWIEVEEDKNVKLQGR